MNRITIENNIWLSKPLEEREEIIKKGKEQREKWKLQDEKKALQEAKKELKKQKFSKEIECPICLEENSDLFPPCGHWVHRDCQNKCKQSNICTICKQDYYKDFNKEKLEVKEEVPTRYSDGIIRMRYNTVGSNHSLICDCQSCALDHEDECTCRQCRRRMAAIFHEDDCRCETCNFMLHMPALPTDIVDRRENLLTDSIEIEIPIPIRYIDWYRYIPTNREYLTNRTVV